MSIGGSSVGIPGAGIRGHYTQRARYRSRAACFRAPTNRLDESHIGPAGIGAYNRAGLLELPAMAMSTGTANGQVMVEMNTTPLIDVMLVLLVLLIVTLPIQTHAVKLDMPAVGPPPIIEPPIVNLAVDFD